MRSTQVQAHEPTESDNLILVERITATEASRNFADLLNRAKYGGESFEIERNGEVVARLTPAKPKPLTVSEINERLKKMPHADDQFQRDMAEIIAESRSRVSRDPWAE
jgi:prevent-host-death family protein